VPSYKPNREKNRTNADTMPSDISNPTVPMPGQGSKSSDIADNIILDNKGGNGDEVPSNDGKDPQNGGDDDIDQPLPNADAYASCGSGGETGFQVKVPFDEGSYYVTTPENYDPDKAYPVVFGLHGDEGSPSSVNSVWKDLSGKEFIMIAPQAIVTDQWRQDYPSLPPRWYGSNSQLNSVYMDNMLASIKSKYNVDLDRVYIWGLSGGAAFISGYAMKRTGTFAAIHFMMGGARSNATPVDDGADRGCSVATRFAVSDSDFLYPGAIQLYNYLKSQGKDTEWAPTTCTKNGGHCWDVEAEEPAKNWMLSKILCNERRPPGCAL